MVRFMAFSCKTGSIDRCLGLDVLAPAPGGFPTLLARLSLQLKIISPRMYLAFIFLYLICSLSAIWSPVSMCLPQYTHMNLGISGGEEEEEEDWAGIEEVNSMMQKPVPAGPYCEAACRNNINTSVHWVTPRSLPPTYPVNQPVNED